MKTGKFVSLMLVVLMGLSAEAQRGRGPDDRGPGRGGPGRGNDERGRPDRGGGRHWDRDKELIAYLNQSIRGQGTIDLNYELRLDQHRGKIIQEVIVVASSREDRRDRRRNPAAEVSLRVDNRTMGMVQRIGDRTSEISLGRNMNLELGRGASNLALDIRGDDVFVSEVIVVVERGNGGGGGGGSGRDVISQTINRDVRRGDDMNLNYMLRLDQRDADQAEAIVVRARSNDRNASVQAVAGFDSGDTQYLTSDTREFVLYLPRGQRNRDMRNIRLIVRGDAYVETVGVKLSRR
jgi:hypothetical protein